MPNYSLSLPFKKQEQFADCLPACAAMVLSHLGVRIRYGRLVKLLRTTPFGTSAFNLQYLERIGVKADVDDRDMEQLRVAVQNGVPTICFVTTAHFNHWQYETDHAVVVIGFEDDAVLIHDPANETYPLRVENTDFELAWLKFDYLSATLQL